MESDKTEISYKVWCIKAALNKVLCLENLGETLKKAEHFSDMPFNKTHNKFDVYADKLFKIFFILLFQSKFSTRNHTSS